MKRFFLFFTLLALLSGCGKDENESGGGNTGGGNNPNTPSTQTSISISPSALTFDAQGETKSVTVTCTTGKTWTLSGGESWCTASGSNGNNGATVTFTAEANTSPDERNATYTFTCGDKTAKLVVTQKQQDALTVTSSKVEVDAQGGPINVEVKANIPFEYVIADKDKGWITPVETKSMQTTVLSFNIAQNESIQKREGTITIKSGELNETITVYQAGEQPTIVITQNTYEVSGKGETIKVEINSNVEFSVSIPATYSAWIQEAAEPRALSTHTKYFTISINLETQSRTGEILFTSQEHNLTEKVTIQQNALSDDDYTTVHVPTKGTLASVLAENDLDASSIVLLKITGEINDVDMVRMQDMPNLISLDISGTNLTALPAGTFQKLKNLKKVILPNTLISIGGHAFAESGLQSIEIPASVETIATAAFKGCTALTTVTFEKGSQLKTIEGGYSSSSAYYGAFEGCTSLTSIEIPASAETIGENAFNRCKALTTVTFEKGSQLKIIEVDAFEDCTSLTSIEIPASVETIERNAFNRCKALTTVTFEKGSQLKTIEGGYYDKTTDCYGAFSDCTSLTSIEIPASVETIGSTAFKRCTALTTVTFEKGSQLKTIEGGDVFSDYYGAFSDCTSLTSIEIPASVETIGSTAFKRCTALTTVTFEKGSQLKIIELDTFRSCHSLTSIEIPASVETIGAAAFIYCTALTTVTFEKGSQLKTIWGGHDEFNSPPIYYGAFSYLPNLKIMDMSTCTQVEELGTGAFANCSSLQLFKIGTIKPPYSNLYWTTFDNLPTFSILKVPAESVDAYKKANGWNFSNISALD